MSKHMLHIEWVPQSNVDFAPLIHYLLELRPQGRQLHFNCSGTRWPMDVEIETFQKLLSKRGADQLREVQLGSDGPRREFYLWLSKRHNLINDFLWVADDSIWSEQHDRDLINHIIAIVNIQYGYSSFISPSVPINGGGRNYRYITTADNISSKMLSVYRAARTRWDYLNGWLKIPFEQGPLEFLFLLFQTNILNKKHLNFKPESSGKCLREWIGQKKSRGELEDVNRENAIWHILPSELEGVYREIWHTGYLPVTEHFEITEWDANQELPMLKAKGSLQSLLSEVSLSHAEFLPGEEPEHVTAYKKKIGIK